MQHPSDQISNVITQNSEVADEVRSAADDLGVVHAVLSTSVPLSTHNDDLHRAVARVAKIEQKLENAATSLDDSNERLKDVIEGGA